MNKYPISYSKKRQVNGYVALTMDNKPAAFAPTLDAIREYVVTENRRHYCYKEFPSIAIPAFLQGEGWEDTSWGNDTTASSTWTSPEWAKQYELRVWVYADDPKERENPDDKKFCVSVYELFDVGSDMLEADECDTEAEAIAWVNTYRESIKLLAENAKRNK